MHEEAVEHPLDARVRFDNYEFQLLDILDGVGYAGLISGQEVIAFMCNDSFIVVGPTDPPELEELRTFSETIAEQRSCAPPLSGPYECLGIPSDPVACSE